MNLFAAIDRLKGSNVETPLFDLIQMAGLDPEVDLQGCNFSDVDFGIMDLPLINLTNCDLRGAKLDGITGRVIIAGAKVDQSTALPTLRESEALDLDTRLEQLMRYINNFHIPTYVPEDVVRNLEEHRLVYAGYNSFTEQDITAREIETLINLESSRKLMPFRDIRVITLTSHDLKQFPQSLSSVDCDTLFERLYASRPHSFPLSFSEPSGMRILTDPDDQGVSFLSDNFRNYINHVTGNTTPVGKFLTENVKQRASALNHSGPLLLIFSGFPPISENLWRMLRKQIPSLRVVILCPTSLLLSLPISRSKQNRKGFATGPAITPRDRLGREDINSFIHRLIKFEKVNVFMDKSLESVIWNCAGEPLNRLKEVMYEAIIPEIFQRELTVVLHATSR